MSINRLRDQIVEVIEENTDCDPTRATETADQIIALVLQNTQSIRDEIRPAHQPLHKPSSYKDGNRAQLL